MSGPDGDGPAQTPDLPLFVYGTLATGGAAEAMIGRRRRGPASTVGRLFHLPAGYPAMQLGGVGRVFGEWVDPVPAARLVLLDEYEGVGEDLFQRVIVEVTTDGATFPAWAWVMEDPRSHGGVLVPSGRWRSVVRR